MSDIDELDIRATLLEIEAGLDKLMSVGFKKQTLVILLAHHTKLSQKTIKLVLSGLSELEEEYFGEED